MAFWLPIGTHQFLDVDTCLSMVSRPRFARTSNPPISLDFESRSFLTVSSSFNFLSGLPSVTGVTMLTRLLSGDPFTVVFWQMAALSSSDTAVTIVFQARAGTADSVVPCGLHVAATSGSARKNRNFRFPTQSVFNILFKFRTRC